jgi:peptidylprolyl isomerase/FKBP-type peptidyl-prolyl cis-trans isomerase FklB
MFKAHHIAPVLIAALATGACHAQGQAKAGGAPAASGPAAFMAKTAKEPGVITLPDGLEYKVLRSGPRTGPSPRSGDEVKVNYEGTLTDGTVCDSSYRTGEPVVFPVGGLIPAWNEALTLMKPGDAWILYVPPALGYGPEGKGPIPPDSVMVFKLELLGVLPSAPGAALGLNGVSAASPRGARAA